MKKETGSRQEEPIKGALDKVDVWLTTDTKARLVALAAREQRSANKQAVYFIENGVNGIDLTKLAQFVERVDAKLDIILRKLGEK